MLKRQHQLQRNLIKLSSQAELVPLLRSEIGALKGMLHASHDALLICNSERSILITRLNRIMVTEQRMKTRAPQLLRDQETSNVCFQQTSREPIFKAALDEACDE